MRVLTASDVERLLTVEEAIDVVDGVFRRTGTSAIVQPVRTIVRTDGRSAILGSMPAFVEDGTGAGFGLKAVVVDPDNAARGLETHQGVVIAYDDETGRPDAVIEAGSLTAIRTAAASAVATRALAQVRSRRIAVVGTGLQAKLHLRAIAAVHAVEVAAVWGRDRERAEALARWVRDLLPVNVEVCADLHEATRHADVISTVTSARHPLLAAADVRAGAHVNAVGSCFPDARELATDLVGAARIVVDVRAAARVEAGDLLLAAAELGPIIDEAAELGEVLRGEAPARESDDEVTVFESLGFAALDVATARRLVRLAAEQGVGTEVALDRAADQSR